MPKFAQDILNVEMDDEFKEIVEKYAEKEPTPMEMDLKVRMDRVIYVLNRTLAVIRVMMYLPTFLQDNAEVMRRYLQQPDVYFILRLLNRYGGCYDLNVYRKNNCLDYTDVLEQTNIQKMPNRYIKHTTSQGTVSHPHISQMIDVFFNNKCIRQLVADEERKIFDKHLADFLNTMEELKNVAKEIIYETGEEEAVKDKELRQAFKHNVLVVASIKEFEARLERQRKDLGEQLDKKVAVFTTYNSRIEKIKEEFHEKVVCNLAASEKEMMNETVHSEEKQSILAEEAKQITRDYELLLEEHLGMEKQSRSKRFKAETQLQNWVIKYDQDIGERQAEYEAFKEKYDEEREALEALQDLLDDQEDEYTFLMKEKAEEEERIYNEMAFHLLQSRCAKVIQRAWRAYVQRKKSRRKGKKGKGKGGKGGGKPKGGVKTGKPKETTELEKLDEDPNVLLRNSKKFKAEVFDDIQDPHAFDLKVDPLDM